MKKNLDRNIRFGFTIAILLLLASAAASYYTINKLIASSRMVDHTQKVLIESENIVSAIKDGESGQRGFLLTKQADFMTPYIGSFNRAMAALNELKLLISDNREQLQNADTLEVLIVKRFAILDQSIEDVRRGLQPDFFRLRDGQVYMSNIRLLTRKMQRIEEALLRERTLDLNNFIRFAPLAIIMATVLALLITIFFFRKVADDSKKKSAMADELRYKDEQMSERIRIIQSLAGKLAEGDFSIRLNAEENDNLGSLAGSLNKMAVSLDRSFHEISRNEWLQEGTAQLG